MRTTAVLFQEGHIQCHESNLNVARIEAYAAYHGILLLLHHADDALLSTRVEGWSLLCRRVSKSNKVHTVNKESYAIWTRMTWAIVKGR